MTAMTKARHSFEGELIASSQSRANTFVEFTRDLRGMHPVAVKCQLESDDPTRLRKLLENEPAMAPMEVGRQDNPVLNAWYYTEQTSDAMAQMVDWRQERVGLFGTPGVLLSAVRRFNAPQITLFDLEPPVLLRAPPGADVAIVDIDNFDFAPFGERFDRVFVDAPWYLTDFNRWLSKAFSCVRPGGIVHCALWPVNLRASAKEERARIIDLWGANGATAVLSDNALSYEVPSFEAAQLSAQGIPPRPWKSADLLTLSKGHSVPPALPLARSRSHAWREIRVGSIRYFLRHGSEPAQSGFLACADGQNAMLRSPSLRDAGRSKANVLSSMGHGLICSDQTLLGRILYGAAERGVVALREFANEVDPAALALLEDVLFGKR